jgi:hypothetical protein
LDKKSKSISKSKKPKLKNKNILITNNNFSTNKNLNKKIPFINNYNIKNNKINQVNSSKESINTNYTVTSTYSNNLTEHEKITLSKIQNMMFNLISTSHNRKEILKEFELIHEYSQTSLVAHLMEKYDIKLINEACDEKTKKILTINQ